MVALLAADVSASVGAPQRYCDGALAPSRRAADHSTARAAPGTCSRTAASHADRIVRPLRQLRPAILSIRI